MIGGTGVVGRAVRARLEAEGARVMYTTRAEPAAPGLRLDLREPAAIGEVVDAAARGLGGLDAMVYCAAVAETPRPPEASGDRLGAVDPAGWDAVMAVNARGAFFACQRAVEHLRRAGGGELVLIGSVDAVKPVPTPIHHAASKAALDATGRALAQAVGADNIRVNVLHPGLLEGGLSRALDPELRADFVKHSALRRAGRPEEVAAVVAWFVGHNTYVTGQSILVDGGL